MKLLLLGGNGMAGSMMDKYLSNYFEIKTWSRAELNYPCEIPTLDQFDYVINCIGLIKQKSSNAADFYTINSEFPIKLSEKCNKLIHISSDCVFSGTIPENRSYKTTDTKDAQDDYGRSKALGEDIPAMVLRTSIIGPSRDAAGLFEWFRNTHDNPVKGFTNHWWSGCTTLELAKTVQNIINNDQYQVGIKQVASNTVSKYELLCSIKQHFNLSKSIEPHQDLHSINRSLIPDIKLTSLDSQLEELKTYETS